MSTEWVLNFIRWVTSLYLRLLSTRAEKNAVVYSCCPEPYPFVDIHISIERRPMFYVRFPKLITTVPGFQLDSPLRFDQWNRSARILHAQRQRRKSYSRLEIIV